MTVTHMPNAIHGTDKHCESGDAIISVLSFECGPMQFLEIKL